MKDLELIKLPNPKLRMVSKEIDTINQEVETLASKMVATAFEWEENKDYESTVGLAAVQVGHLRRVIIIRQSNFKKPDDFVVLINPRIVKATGGQVESFEGCLSVNRYYSKVARYRIVRAEALDLSGEKVFINLDGFLAKVLQHEIDHLNGVLTVDRVTDKDSGFCCLNKDGKLEAIDYSEVLKSGILK